jgi:membrane protein
MLLGGIVDFILRLTSIVLVCVALVALYALMPNVRVRAPSALFGGVVAGLLWQGLLLLHVKFQLGVANYNALYAGFAAVPIFLVWVYLSWTIVLIGAQLAASHQYEQRMKQAVRSRHVDQELKEDLAVIVAAAVARCFLEGHAPPTSLELADALAVPPPPVEQVLGALVRAGLLVRVAEGGEQGYDPARDLDAVRMADLEEAVRSDPDAGGLKLALEQTIGPELTTLLRSREGALKDSGSMTLRQLATRLPVRVDGVTASAAASIPPAAAGKKPDLPA